MIDLHCHILPSVDDGAADLSVSHSMARAFLADGVTDVVCTPHILPGLYHNTGAQIRQAVASLQQNLQDCNLPLRLHAGADNHVAADFVEGLRRGHLLSIANSRYVLVEPPHHVAPPKIEALFFSILVAGFVPILTHPERLTWIYEKYSVVERLIRAGVWMQITSGSLSGAFGREARYWSERMLEEGRVHVLATDAHDAERRPPALGRGRALAALRVGEVEARHLVLTRPQGVLANVVPSELPQLPSGLSASGLQSSADDNGTRRDPATPMHPSQHRAGLGNLAQQLRRFFE